MVPKPKIHLISRDYLRIHLPVWSPRDPLVHIGTMSTHDKGMRGDSLEGHGLSVSECPEAWQKIAKLGGNPWWTLASRDGVEPSFLDWHSVSESAIQDIMSWAVARGLCVPAIGYKVSWYDSEFDGMVFSTYESRDAAVIEYEPLAEERTGEEAEFAPKLEEFMAFALMPSALGALSRKKATLDETPELVALLFTEIETDLDGVFWNDDLDPSSFSAPRAVIFPGRLAKFDVHPHQQQKRNKPRF